MVNSAKACRLGSRLFLSPFDKIFFCNSGAEANEAAIKLARKWGKRNRDGAYAIISADHAFHGRTLATVTATGKEAYTRAGDLRVSPTGAVTTASGLAVLTESGPLVIPPSRLSTHKLRSVSKPKWYASFTDTYVARRMFATVVFGSFAAYLFESCRLCRSLSAMRLAIQS